MKSIQKSFWSSGLPLAFVSVDVRVSYQMSARKCQTSFVQWTSNGVNYFLCKKQFILQPTNENFVFLTRWLLLKINDLIYNEMMIKVRKYHKFFERSLGRNYPSREKKFQMQFAQT
jgi:hypothetical protein